MMIEKNPIGVFDSGVGGFSVVREIQRVLPSEDIIYFGDSANMPYGNRPREEILRMTRQILGYMGRRGVKVAAIACNTISTLIDEFRDSYPFKVFSVVESGSFYAAELDADNIGVLGTCFTAQSGVYERLIQGARPSANVVAAGCPNLARLIDSGMLAPKQVDPELKTAIGSIFAKIPMTHLILACTHFPLVENRIRELYPGLALIDSGRQQALDLKRWLEGRNLLNPEGRGGFELNTSGDTALYAESVERFGLKKPDSINHIDIVTPY